MLRVVSVSGGKDSTACALLALERHPADEIRLVFADTGNEHPSTYEYVHDYMPRALGLPVHVVRADLTDWWWRRRDYVRDVWPTKLVEKSGLTPDESAVVVARALSLLEKGPTGNPFLDLCIIKARFPSRRAQFCTQFLKTEPITEWTLELLATNTVESWQGIRADESAARANALEREDQGGGYSVYRPILRWTAQQCVDYVHSRGLQLNPLYAQGSTRVGCMPCINSSKAEIANIATRWPEVIDRIREWERITSISAKRSETSFFSAPDAEGRGARQGRGIDAMVQWSKTTRGGKQFDLIAHTAETPTCASAYGLCE
jgi:3'-phosphoadenosine 5'-phosphosulfate sulfotransferase (PAPS reductase)/FAD synthetase